MTVPLDQAKFHVIQVDTSIAAAAGKHRRWADVGIRFRPEHEDRLASALRWPSWRSWRVHGFPNPKQHPDEDEQMTLVVRLPVLARRSRARQFGAVRRLVTNRLDKAGVDYTITEVKVGGLIYLPKNTGQDSDDR